MSQIFSGELSRLEDIAWKHFSLLSRCPSEFKTTCDAILSMIGALRLIQKSIEDQELSTSDKEVLQGVLRSCSGVLSSLQTALAKLPSSAGKLDAVEDIRTSILAQIDELSAFFAVIRRHSQDSISTALDDMRKVENTEFQNSIETDWRILRNELVKHGCEISIIDGEYFFIEQWLEDNPFRFVQDSRDVPRISTPILHDTVSYEAARPISTTKSFLSAKFDGSDGLIVQSPEKVARNSVRRKPIHSSRASSSRKAPSQSSSSPYSELQTLGDSGVSQSNSDYAVRPKPDLENGLIVRSPSTHDKGLILQSSIQTFEDGLILQEVPPYKPPVVIDGIMPLTGEFEAYKAVAINDEACRLLVEQERNPSSCPRANLWLPANLQPVYEGEDAQFILPIMAQSSFSVMSYQSAPKLGKDIVRLQHLLHSSYSSGRMGSKDGVVADAFFFLETVSSPLARFNFLRNPNAGGEPFSDLDVLDFECSTIGITDNSELFPKLEFDLAHQSYWGLLSHLMGLLQAVTDIFQGRAYITRSRQELQFLWDLHKINSHVAWVQAQLADWDKVENAVRFCRHWHSQQLNLRDQAVRMLRDWKSAQKILMGAEGVDIIELSIRSAEDLPKYKFSRPGAFAKIKFYKRNIHGRAEHSLDMSTQTAPPGRIAIWEKSMKLSITPAAKYIDVVIHQVMATGNEVLERAQLTFEFPPGGEATFMNKSLMYGIDENLAIKIPCKQNKTGEPVILNIGVKWSGRYEQVERAGLPTQPPGKMFRRNISGIPILKEIKPNPATPTPIPAFAHNMRELNRQIGGSGVISAF